MPTPDVAVAKKFYAETLGLDGFVANDERGVVLEIEGAPAAIERFLERLPREAPALDHNLDRLMSELEWLRPQLNE